MYCLDRGQITTTEDGDEAMSQEKGCEAELYWFCFYYLYLVFGMVAFLVIFCIACVLKDCLFGSNSERQAMALLSMM